jgi:hypothetical protein
MDYIRIANVSETLFKISTDIINRKGFIARRHGFFPS